MENLNSVIGFFYNIIPGLLFFYLNNDKIKIINIGGENDGLRILLLLAFSLFIGFIFQSITKIFRDILFGNKVIFSIIKFRDNIKYEGAIIKLNKIKRENKNDVIKNFYFMHNYLSSNKYDRLPEHFSSRFAFWSNIFFALLFSLILNYFIFHQNQIELPFTIITLTYPWIIFGALYSFLISILNFYSMYETVVNSFITVTSSSPKKIT